MPTVMTFLFNIFERLTTTTLLGEFLTCGCKYVVFGREAWHPTRDLYAFVVLSTVFVCERLFVFSVPV